MRTTFDRWRHAIGFEIIGLILIVGVMSSLLGFSASHMGALGVFFSVVAMGWNYIYNIGFDRAMVKYTGSVHKSTRHRIYQAVGFELGLLWLTIPAIAWWLEISLMSAVVMDLGLVVFYLFYAFGYNWAYDKIFPLPTTSAVTAEPQNAG